MPQGGVTIEGLGDVTEMLVALGGDLEKAGNTAQTRMAFQIRVAEQNQMRTDLDRPTPWSLGSIRYKRAGILGVPPQPVVEGAAVYFETTFGYQAGLEPEEYLGVQIVGGVTAGPKRSEKRLQMIGALAKDYVWVPDKSVKLDRYGNMKGSAISAMLTDLGVNPYANSGGKNFTLWGPRDKPYGIKTRIGEEWYPWMWFVPRQQYTARWRFYERADEEVKEKFTGILDEEVTRALRRL